MPDAAARNDREFLRLYDELKREAYGYSMFCTGSREVAEDVCQDSFLRLFTALRDGREVSSPRHYLLRSIRNAAMNQRMRDSTWRNLLPALTGLRAVDGGTGAGSPSDAMERREIEAGLQEALGRIPRAQAEVIALRYFSQLSYQEIADLVGDKVSTVTNRCHDGVRNVAMFLREGLE